MLFGILIMIVFIGAGYACGAILGIAFLGPIFYILGVLTQLEIFLFKYLQPTATYVREEKAKRVKKYKKIKVERKMYQECIDFSGMLTVEESYLYGKMVEYHYGSFKKADSMYTEYMKDEILKLRDKVDIEKLSDNDKVNLYFDEIVKLEKIIIK